MHTFLGLFTALLLLTTGAFQFLTLPIVAKIILVGIFVFFTVKRTNQAQCAVVVGFLSPWFSSLSAGSLFVAGVLYVLTTLQWKNLFQTVRWATPFWVVLVAWQVAWWGGLAEWNHLWGMVSNASDPAQSFQRILSERSLPVFAQFFDFGRLLLLLVMIGLLSDSTERREGFWKGLVGGIVVSLIVSAVQIFSSLGQFFPAQSDFWSSINRFAGAFSDPNAFGVASFLLFVVLFVVPRLNSWLRVLLVFGVFTLALFSGSRSFFLGVFLFGSIVFFDWLHREKSIRLALLGLGGVFFASAFVFLLLSHFAVLPVGVERLLHSLDLSRLDQSLFSRMVFNQIGLAMWSDYPLLGAGFSRFPALVTSYSEYLKLGIGTWLDNPNNFYLGILAETGLVGFCAFLLSLFSLQKKRSDVTSVASFGVYAYLVILLVGPHHLHDSVAFILAALVGASFSVKEASWFPSSLALQFFPFLAALYTLFFLFVESGFYPWERDQGGFFRWTRKEAQGYLRCTGGETTRLQLLNRRPDGKPVWVTVSVKDQERVSAEVASGATKVLSFACPTGSWTGLRYHLTVQNLVQPAAIAPQSGDHRFLGVIVVAGSPEDSVSVLRAERNPFVLTGEIVSEGSP